MNKKITVEEWLGKDNTIGHDIWHKKYQQNGELFDAWLDRVSHGDMNVRQLICEKKFLFAGRILSNRANGIPTTKSTYSNCYVVSPPEDSIESIFDCAKGLARTFSYGGGCGVDLSKLAPRGAKVNNTAKETSGAVSFMDLYSMTTGLIGQNGRRGALMLSLDCSHPDVEEFIKAKSDLERITKANISVRITNDFMRAVADNISYKLSFHRAETKESIERIVQARDVFDLIVKMNWDYAEPGALFWDTICNWNLLSNTKEFEYAGVNPCAEEPLPAGGSCLLGSVNLSEFVQNPFDTTAYVDFDDLKKTVKIAVRAMNDVLEEGLSLHPLQEQRDSVCDWRQIGIGIFGLADMLIKLGIAYGSEESLSVCDKIGFAMANTAIKESARLARENGAFPKCRIRELVSTPYFIANTTEKTRDMVLQYGLLNSQLLTIAPTGSLSTMLGVSGGIEPIFANSYNRKTESLHNREKTYKVYTPIVEQYIKMHQISEDQLPEFFVTSKDLNYVSRIDMQSIWQSHIDASISSTVNVPEDFTVDQVYDLYMRAWEKGLKGVTVFRDGCKRGGVLTTEDKWSKQPEVSTALSRGDIIDCTNDLVGKKRRLVTGCGTVHCLAWFDPVTGDLMETFMSKGATGGCRCNMDATSRLISLASRGGICIESVLDQLSSCGGCDAYRSRKVSHGDTSKGTSCPTAFAYAIKEMHREMLDDLGLLEAESAKEVKRSQKPKQDKVQVKLKCPECGEEIQFEGGCNICKACGWSKCG